MLNNTSGPLSIYILKICLHLFSSNTYASLGLRDADVGRVPRTNVPTDLFLDSPTWTRGRCTQQGRPFSSSPQTPRTAVTYVFGQGVDASAGMAPFHRRASSQAPDRRERDASGVVGRGVDWQLDVRVDTRWSHSSVTRALRAHPPSCTAGTIEGGLWPHDGVGVHTN
jgi:hypothetical protein